MKNHDAKIGEILRYTSPRHNYYYSTLVNDPITRNLQQQFRFLLYKKYQQQALIGPKQVPIESMQVLCALDLLWKEETQAYKANGLCSKVNGLSSKVNGMCSKAKGLSSKKETHLMKKEGITTKGVFFPKKYQTPWAMWGGNPKYREDELNVFRYFV